MLHGAAHQLTAFVFSPLNSAQCKCSPGTYKPVLCIINCIINSRACSRFKIGLKTGLFYLVRKRLRFTCKHIEVQQKQVLAPQHNWSRVKIYSTPPPPQFTADLKHCTLRPKAQSSANTSLYTPGQSFLHYIHSARFLQHRAPGGGYTSQGCKKRITSDRLSSSFPVFML